MTVRPGRVATAAALLALGGCGALTAKSEFRQYEAVALERDAIRRYQLAQQYLGSVEDPAYGPEVARLAEQARPAVEQVRAAEVARERARTEAEQRGRAQVAEAERRLEAERLAQEERQRRAQEAGEAAERNRRAAAAFDTVRALVSERVAGEDWDGAARAIGTWLAEFGGTTTQPDVEALRPEVERGRQLARVIASTGATRLPRPATRYAAIESVAIRMAPDGNADPRREVRPLRRGERVEVWYRTPDGWMLVALPDAGGAGGRLTWMLGWVESADLTARDLIAEEDAVRDREAREAAERAAAEAAESARRQRECSSGAAAWGRLARQGEVRLLTATAPPTVVLQGAGFTGPDGVARARSLANAVARHALCTNASIQAVRVMTIGGAIVATVRR